MTRLHAVIFQVHDKGQRFFEIGQSLIAVTSILAADARSDFCEHWNFLVVYKQISVVRLLRCFHPRILQQFFGGHIDRVLQSLEQTKLRVVLVFERVCFRGPVRSSLVRLRARFNGPDQRFRPSLQQFALESDAGPLLLVVGICYF